MQKTKRNKNEVAYQFAARVINGYGDYISAQEAWSRLVNKKGVGMKGWVAFQTHLAGAARQGLLSKMRGQDSKGRNRMLYGPLNEAPAVVEEVVEVVRRSNRPPVDALSIGDLLDYNGTQRDDFMSVLADLIYDTTLRDVRERYPTLEALVWDIVGGDA